MGRKEETTVGQGLATQGREESQHYESRLA